MSDIKIVVATHKEYEMPADEIYLPVFVGSAISDKDLPYHRDDEGENISAKNKTYCELTGLYWAWKNLDADYIGMNHYRRYFSYGIQILRHEDAEKVLKNKDVILPGKRNYYIETVYSQFVHAHGNEALDAARMAIEESYPAYLGSFDELMKKRSVHIFNMFIMKKDIFDRYCSFLFDVLGNIEDRIEMKDRIFGYLGERLLDVFINGEGLEYAELPVYKTEKDNWLIKGGKFLLRKFGFNVGSY